MDPKLLETYDKLGVPLHELFREKNPADLSDEQLLKRVLEMESEARAPLLQVIEGYLRYYEQDGNIHPRAAERLAELKGIRKEQEQEGL